MVKLINKMERSLCITMSTLHYMLKNTVVYEIRANKLMYQDIHGNKYMYQIMITDYFISIQIGGTVAKCARVTNR